MSSGSGSERARRALTYLRRRISDGDWAIGTKIPIEADLMEEIGAGKSTVREAVRSLASVGMLETLVGRGTFVRALTPVSAVLAEYLDEYDLEEVLSYRRVLEVEAAGLAAQHRSDEALDKLRAANEANIRLGSHGYRSVEAGRVPGEFHALVFHATGTRLLSDAYTGVLAAMRRAIDEGRIIHAIDGDRRQQEHSEILNAITDHDSHRATSLMRRHVAVDLCSTRTARETPHPRGT